MELSDYGDLLRACAFYDNRKVTREAAIAWQLAIDKDMTKADALKAIAEHHGESTEYILPAHVNKRVKSIHRERLQRAGDPPMPGDLTWEQEREWRQLWCERVKSGMDKGTAAESASREMNLFKLPVADRKAALAELVTASKRVPTPGHPATNRTEL